MCDIVVSLLLLGHSRWGEILGPIFVLLSGSFGSHYRLWHHTGKISSSPPRAPFATVRCLRAKLSCCGGGNQNRPCYKWFARNPIVCWRKVGAGTKREERKAKKQLQEQAFLWNQRKNRRKRGGGVWFYFEHLFAVRRWKNCEQFLATDIWAWSATEVIKFTEWH